MQHATDLTAQDVFALQRAIKHKYKNRIPFDPPYGKTQSLLQEWSADYLLDVIRGMPEEHEAKTINQVNICGIIAKYAKNPNWWKEALDKKDKFNNRKKILTNEDKRNAKRIVYIEAIKEKIPDAALLKTPEHRDIIDKMVDQNISLYSLNKTLVEFDKEKEFFAWADWLPIIYKKTLKRERGGKL